MSHYAVTIIHKQNQNIEDLLAPYQENNMGDCPKQHLEFVDRMDELKKLYKKYKEEDQTLEDYARECGYEWNKEEQSYGYYENPNAKWDWYEIGGRWNNSLRTKDKKRVNSELIKNIDFSMDKEVYNKHIRFWELYIEKGYDNLTKEEKEEIGFVFYKESYFTNRYKTKEEYAEIMASFSTFAVITPDGEWHEKGDMGWFGFSSETDEESVKWDKSFYNSFIKDTKEDYVITIVDCHI